jgi:hypothetical protein
MNEIAKLAKRMGETLYVPINPTDFVSNINHLAQ